MTDITSTHSSFVTGFWKNNPNCTLEVRFKELMSELRNRVTNSTFPEIFQLHKLRTVEYA